MTDFAVLVQPSANRVYGQAAPRLACAELRVLLGVEGEVVELGGVPYIGFSADDGVDLGPVSALSSLYALFEVADGLLRPVPVDRGERFDDDLITIQRYTGKTNEQFTKLLLNLAVASATGSGGVRRVLDPLAGRGTTLNHALLAGLDAAGVEADGRAVDAYEAFLSQWLKDKRVKHKVARARVRREGKVVGRRFDVVVDGSLSVTMIHDDTRFVREHFGKGSFDAVVADLPYGVQHGGRAEDGRRARSPLALVESSVEGWAAVLRAGGAMALACNVRTLPRADVADVLAGAGLSVCPYEGFEHRVDHAIQRDVVVAVKPGRAG
ncbi:MAG TPA: hypothetical protein VGO92_06840 [Acidimicrobiales bacterium]|nr:hypothetical protein [Acidimicrobiales bacterium]